MCCEEIESMRGQRRDCSTCGTWRIELRRVGSQYTTTGFSKRTEGGGSRAFMRELLIVSDFAAVNVLSWYTAFLLVFNCIIGVQRPEKGAL
eukprot:IDg18688t1